MSREPKAGEDVIFLGQPHRIVEVEPYTHPEFPGETWWIVRDAYGWSMTVVPTEEAA